MKTAIITFKNPAAEIDGGNIGTLAKTLFGGGFSADFLEILPTGDAASFRHSLERYKDVADNLIITDGKTTGFDLKEIICEVQGTSLSENENALRFAEAACPHGEEFGRGKVRETPGGSVAHSQRLRRVSRLYAGRPRFYAYGFAGRGNGV